MTTLGLPSTPGFAASRFGLVSNTQVFENPLTGQAQTLERPGARWQASYTLPPMKRAEAAQWQSFLAQLRGGAGRFYGFDPDAKTPRGTGLVGIASRNEIRNGNALGAVNGVVGSGGAAPTYFAFSSASGITREVIGSGTEAGIPYVEIRFYGTPTANPSLSFEYSTQVVCAEGETWTGSFYYRQTGGALTNINNVQQFFSQQQANGTINSNSYSNVGTVDATWRRSVYTKVLTDTTPDTARLRNGLYLSCALGSAIDITLRVGQMQLERTSSVTPYIPTTGSARSRDAGARCENAQVAGSTLATWNWQPSSAVLKAGDYVAFDTTSGRELHMVMADVTADANGRATLTLEPPLRTPPGDNAALVIQSASCVMALDEASVSWEGNAQGVYRLSFSATERF